MKLLQTTTTRQKLMLAASALAVLVIAYLLFSLATKPSYSMLSTGLDPAQTGKMTAALDAQGIGYELRNNGTALAVEKTKTAQAQIALSQAGLRASGTTEPWAGFDKQKLGSSSFQQKVAYQRALEAQIAQTIGQVGGVSGAQVQLTMPDDRLFADEAKPATAAVLLSGDSSALAPGAVRGIANLVASSVQDLKTENVTITDGSGQLLWPAGDGTVGGAGALSKPAAEARYASGLEASLNAMLARTLGPNKAQVQVNADLNVDDTSIEKLQYGKQGTPLQQTTENERLRGSGAAGGAAAGTASNVPGYAAAGAGGGGRSNYNSRKRSTDFGVDKTVTRTKVAPGTVQRLNLALVVDKSVPAAEVSQLQAAVASAAGIDRRRGDTLAVSQVAFTTQPAPPAAGLVPSGGIVGYAKYALLGLACLLFLFFLTRHLRRRENEALVDPTWLRQLDAPTPIAQLADGPPPSLVPASNPRRQQIEEVVTKEPERVAAAVRNWMNEDSAG
ncbi:MAG: flagellar basal-body MS-ring/collar protein FliF [Solirubrobacteraceae bacterium]